MAIFGPPIAKHGPNKIPIAILLILGVGSVALSWLDVAQKEGDWKPDFVLHLVFVFLFLGWALWISRLRLILHAEGMSIANVFGEKQIRWDEVHQFYYRATKQSVNFIPVGTYYHFKLIDSAGQKISFGSGFENSSTLGNELIGFTQRPIYARL